MVAMEQSELREYLFTERGLALRVAKQLGVTKQAIWQWSKHGVPPTQVLKVEALTGISRHSLRPDIFGPAPDTSTAEA